MEAEKKTARDVLLESLENMDEVRDELGDPDWDADYLIVCWAGKHGDGQTIRGWNATEHPNFVLTGLLREVAAMIESKALKEDDDDGN